MEIKFDVFWPKNLGTLYKDSSIDILGREFTVDLDLKEVKTILVEFKSDVKSFTDLAEIVDIEKRLVRVPFRGDATRYQGVTSFELVAIMKNGETKPSQTYTYSVARSLQNPNNVESDSNYPVLVDLIERVDDKISITNEAIDNVDSSIENMKNAVNAHIKSSSEAIRVDFDTYLENSNNDLGDKFNKYSNKTTSDINSVLDNKCNEVDERFLNKANEVDAKINSHTNTISEMNKEVESTTDRQEHLEDTFNQLVINNGNSNAEIVDARVGENGKTYAKLGDRLDSVDSQLEHKLNKEELRYLNVKDFGAKGDGITDDTQSILNAIDKSVEFNIYRIYLPPGTYKTTKTIYIPSGLEILGGTQLKNNVLIDYFGSSWAIATNGDVGQHRRNKIESINIKLNKDCTGGILLGVIGDSNRIIPVDHTLINIEIHNITGDQIGIMQKNASGIYMQNVKSNWGTGGTGLVIVANGNNSGVCTYNNCSFGRVHQNDIGVDLRGGTGGLDGYSFNGCYFGGRTPFKISGGQTKNISLNAIHVEATPPEDDLTNYYGIDINEVIGFNINGITFASYSKPNFKAFVFRGFCSGVNITGVDCNEFNGGTLYYNRHTNSPRNSIFEYGGLSGVNRTLTQLEGDFSESLVIETTSLNIKNIKTSQIVMTHTTGTSGLRYSNSKPSSISSGDFVYNSTPRELGDDGSKYVILGWSGIGTNIAVECRVLTGN